MQNQATWTKQSWKKRRRMEAPFLFCLAIAALSTGLIVLKTCGHDEE